MFLPSWLKIGIGIGKGEQMLLVEYRTRRCALFVVGLLFCFFLCAEPELVKTAASEAFASALSYKQNTYDRIQFIHRIIGMSEKDFATLSTEKRQGFVFSDGESSFLRTSCGTFAVGSFEVKNIQELRDLWAAKQKKNISAGKGFLRVVEGVGTKNSSWFRSFVDIGALQANPCNKGTAFQVASNFNALEAGGDPCDGVTRYLYTTAQGEEASISAAPAAIYRMYFAQHHGVVGQFEQQINFLEDVPLPHGGTFGVGRVHNGYLEVQHGGVLSKPGTMLSFAEMERLIPLVKVGVHSQVQVTSGLAMLPPNGYSAKTWDAKSLMEKSLKGENVIVDDPEQRVTQIFTAAQNLAQLGTGTCWDDMARMLLHAAYEGTVRAAYVSGCSKLYLTLVGGGVFNNRIDWIVDSIERVMPLIRESGMEVTLVIYNGVDVSVRNRLKAIMLAANTGFTFYTVYKNDGVYMLFDQGERGFYERMTL
ncbi:MAG: hypothetical protein UU47_C0006G0023 [candidate division TM6 bacterium GW2011_GWE2_41_16]|nr:MAG: hypothetical protein UU47_C0006G0023 [candidate division TM6 bacterium GW2011_GWE2_41_16]